MKVKKELTNKNPSKTSYFLVLRNYMDAINPSEAKFFGSQIISVEEGLILLHNSCVLCGTLVQRENYFGLYFAV